MTDGSSHDGNDNELRELRALSGWFLLTAVVFFPLIMNPLIIGFFDKTDDALLEHVADHLTALRWVFTGIGLAELSLGAALWTWGRHVARRTSGRAGRVADVMAWIALAAGVLSLLSRIWNSWFKSATQLADGDLKISDVIFFLPASLGFSASFVAFGVLMIRGAMPTWLGVVWIVCGVMFWLGFLPLWFFVAALVFGIRGLLRFRPGHATADQVSAHRYQDRVLADGAAVD